MPRTLTAGLLCLTTLLPVFIHARDFGDGQENFSPSRLLDNSNGQYNHWSGIGNFEGGSTCTASLLDTRNFEQSATGPAYILTSGHCINRKNGVIDQDLPTDSKVVFHYFKEDAQPQSTWKVKTIKWRTMQGADLALLELEEPLAKLIDAGIQPLRLATEQAAPETDILVVGIPLLLKPTALRLAACTLQASGEVIEQPWVWRSTFKNQCKDITSGSSGSPVLERSSNKIIGVLSTSTHQSSADKRCFFDSPCEVQDHRPLWAAETNYANPVVHLQACFVDGVFTPEAERCYLLPRFSITLDKPWTIPQFVRTRLDENGNPVLPTWNLPFTIDTPRYRYKTTRQASACEDPNGYSHTLEAQNALINDPIGPEVGMHFLCVLGVDSPEQRPTAGMMRNVLTFAVELAEPGPTRAPDLTIVKQASSSALPGDPSGSGETMVPTRIVTVPFPGTVGKPGYTPLSHGSGGYLVTLRYSQPWITRYESKVGNPESTDCNDQEGYKLVLRSPLRFSKERLPLKLCTYAYDMAGQPSEVRIDMLE